LSAFAAKAGKEIDLGASVVPRIGAVRHYRGADPQVAVVNACTRSVWRYRTPVWTGLGCQVAESAGVAGVTALSDPAASSAKR